MSGTTTQFCPLYEFMGNIEMADATSPAGKLYKILNDSTLGTFGDNTNKDAGKWGAVELVLGPLINDTSAKDAAIANALTADRINSLRTELEIYFTGGTSDRLATALGSAITGGSRKRTLRKGGRSLRKNTRKSRKSVRKSRRSVRKNNRKVRKSVRKSVRKNNRKVRKSKKSRK